MKNRMTKTYAHNYAKSMKTPYKESRKILDPALENGIGQGFFTRDQAEKLQKKNKIPFFN